MIQEDYHLAFYEITLVIRQDVPFAQAKALGQQAGEWVESHKGEVTHIEYCGLRPLAYAIGKNKKGHYVFLQVQHHGSFKEIEKRLNLHEDIIRFLVVRVKKHDTSPCPLIVQRKYTTEESATESNPPPLAAS